MKKYLKLGFFPLNKDMALLTRLSFLILVSYLLVVFTFMHHFSFMEGHAEGVYVYFGVFLTIFYAGPGKFSLDERILK